MPPWPLAWFLAMCGAALWLREAMAPPGALSRLLLDAAVFAAFLAVVLFSYLRAAERRQALGVVRQLVSVVW
jgi:hypothetical protein